MNHRTGMIGLEIHTYLVTGEKLFCTCRASRDRGLQPNTHICPICTGQPGAKPMLPNQAAVIQAIQIGLILNCTISQDMHWQRKHYSWPDLPKGYQTTISGSYAVPLGTNGQYEGIHILSMHLEEDPAQWDPETGSVDYNRSGLPLVEIVTAPDFSTAAEVTAWLARLLHHLSYLKAVDSNAGIKVDVNVNIPGKTERVELKNLNSLENISAAIEVELKRQEQEGSVRETRRYDPEKQVTIRMRGKEAADDYRFIPEVDLPHLQLPREFVADIRNKLPPSPQEKLAQLIEQYHLSEADATNLARQLELVAFFEQVCKVIEPNFALPWITGPLMRLLNDHKTSFDHVSINPAHFITLLTLVRNGTITELKAKEILKQFYPRSFEPVVTETKITDARELESLILRILGEHTQAVSDFKAGELKALDFLLGELMKRTQKRADYKISRDILMSLLKS